MNLVKGEGMEIRILVQSARPGPVQGIVLLTEYDILQANDSQLLMRLDIHHRMLHGALVLCSTMEVDELLGRELRLEAIDEWWIGYQIVGHVAGE